MRVLVDGTNTALFLPISVVDGGRLQFGMEVLRWGFGIIAHNNPNVEFTLVFDSPQQGGWRRGNLEIWYSGRWEDADSSLITIARLQQPDSYTVAITSDRALARRLATLGVYDADAQATMQRLWDAWNQPEELAVYGLDDIMWDLELSRYAHFA